MINLKYLVMYRKSYMIHTRKHIAFLIVLLYTLISLFAQDSITINTQEVQVPVQAGIHITLKGQDWTYTRVNMSMRVTSTPLYLASVEDTGVHTIFLFYRQASGVEILHFTRYDNEMGVLYSYDLRVEWKDDDVSPDALVYADDFIRVMLVPPIQEEDDMQSTFAQNMVSAVESDVPEEMEEPVRAVTENTAEESEVLTPAQDTLSAVEDVLEKTQEPVRATVVIENAAEEREVATPDTSSEYAMSKEEMIEFISTQINTMPFNALQQVVEEWSNTGVHSVVDIGNVLWYFAQKLHENMSTLEDITNVLTLYDIIAEQYPLSREYFLAIQKAQQIRQHYIFVLE